jgi:hypothetical protein
MASKTPWGIAPYCLHHGDGTATLHWLKGRPRWALEQLIIAARKGCTPIDNPAPRWSGYVHILRELGFDIETHHEPHGGPFAGTHGRYVLKSRVTRGTEGAAE